MQQILTKLCFNYWLEIVDTATPPNKRSNVWLFVRRAQTRETEVFVSFHSTKPIFPHLLHLFTEHGAGWLTFPNLCIAYVVKLIVAVSKNNCSSLNTCLICINIREFKFSVCMEEECGFKIVKMYFLGLHGTEKYIFIFIL